MAAIFLGYDRVTRGNWIGRLGSEGYWMLDNDRNVVSRFPPWVSGVTFSNPTASDTPFIADPSDLYPQLPGGGRTGAARGRIGAGWTFTISADDDAWRRLTYYLVPHIPSQQMNFTIRDGENNALFDINPDFYYGDTGLHILLAIRGETRIQHTTSSSTNRNLWAMFFDPYIPHHVGPGPSQGFVGHGVF